MTAVPILKKIEKMFDIPFSETRRIIKDFHSEMKNGLSGRKSSLKMIPAYIERPSGKEKGDFLALDLGGTNFRIVALRLNGNRKTSILFLKNIQLGKRYIAGTGREFFDFIAGSIKSFMNENRIDTGEGHRIGFTFSFPVRQISISSGILIRWTKGFRIKDVEGKDVIGLLNESLIRNGLPSMRAVALANDTVSTLVAKGYEDPNCCIGVILGTGTNACYYEKISEIKKYEGPGTLSGLMAVNTEWGNFNKLRLLPYDRELDSSSDNPGEQILEKMVSGMYLGEVARLVIKDLVKRKVLFNGKGFGVFKKQKIFDAIHMSAAEEDSSNNLSVIDRILKELGIKNSKYSDRILLKKVCSVVSTRAAHIIATGIASVITKIDPSLSRKHTIAVDGSIYEKYPNFSRRIRKTLNEIFKGKADNIRLSLTKNGSVKGAAIMAAI